MRILLADDDTRVGKHIRQALIAEGYAVDYAQDGVKRIKSAIEMPMRIRMNRHNLPLDGGLKFSTAATASKKSGTSELVC